MARPLEITVVDDNISITNIISDYIEFSGFNGNVSAFNDSEKALEHVRNNSNIDVIITDYKMPRVNGIQLLEASSESTRKIMISGFLSDIAEDKLKELDVDFLTKPVSMKTLGGMLAEEQEKRIETISQN